MSDKVKFAYYNIIGGGRITAAFKLSGERNQPKRVIEFACSYCSPNDRFEREKGRLISQGRLNNDKTSRSIPIIIEYNNINNPVYKQVVQEIEKNLVSMAPRKINWLTKSDKLIPPRVNFSSHNMTFFV